MRMPGGAREPQGPVTVDAVVPLPSGPRMKQPTTKGGLFSKLLTHLLMGAALGLACATFVLLADVAHLRDFFAIKPDPLIAELSFVLNLSLAFALGATLTGYVFMQMEQR